MIKTTSKSNLRKERFILVYSLRFQVFFIEIFMAEKSEWQEVEAVVPIISVAKIQKVMSACAVLRSFVWNPGSQPSGLTFALQLMESG